MVTRRIWHSAPVSSALSELRQGLWYSLCKRRQSPDAVRSITQAPFTTCPRAQSRGPTCSGDGDGERGRCGCGGALGRSLPTGGCAQGRAGCPEPPGCSGSPGARQHLPAAGRGAGAGRGGERAGRAGPGWRGAAPCARPEPAASAKVRERPGVRGAGPGRAGQGRLGHLPQPRACGAGERGGTPALPALRRGCRSCLRPHPALCGAGAAARSRGGTEGRARLVRPVPRASGIPRCVRRERRRQRERERERERERGVPAGRGRGSRCRSCPRRAGFSLAGSARAIPAGRIFWAGCGGPPDPAVRGATGLLADPSHRAACSGRLRLLTARCRRWHGSASV